jgi:hypothetical protein
MRQVDVIAAIEKKYREELDLYSLLHCLCREQQQAAKRGSTAEILHLEREKEGLMNKIRDLEREIESLRASLIPSSPPAESSSDGGASKSNRQANMPQLRPARLASTDGPCSLENSSAT